MENKNTPVSCGGGIDFFGALTIVFIVLKLCKVISWSWLWVISPIWIPLAIAFIVTIILLIVSSISD